MTAGANPVWDLAINGDETELRKVHEACVRNRTDVIVRDFWE